MVLLKPSVVLLKPAALLRSSKLPHPHPHPHPQPQPHHQPQPEPELEPQPQQGFSESLMAESVEAADAFIRQWVAPQQCDSSSSSSCFLSSLFSPQNREEGRRFLEVLGKLHYAIQSTAVAKPNCAKLVQGRDLMRQAMKHMEKEFYRVMKSNSQYLDPDSVIAWPPRSLESSTPSENASSELGNEKAGFEDSDAMVDLKMIANCMIACGYEKDCVKIYKNIRTQIIIEELSNLGFEKLTSTQMQRMEWEFLEKNIKRWVRIVKLSIKTLFNGERILADRVFASASVAESCFVDITLQSALNLFIFSQTIAKYKKSTEKIFPTLDVYQTILQLMPKINQIFSYDSTAVVRTQANESLDKLAESINSMMTEFQNSITKESSKSAITGGGVHQLSRYVMNFIVFLADYSESLVTILKESPLPLPEDYFKSSGEELPGSGGRSPMAARLAWLVLVLLCKIDAKSRLYNDLALSYLFLANNLYYVVTKVRTSNLRVVLGDDWVTNHEVKVSQYLEKYEKMAWGDVITLLPGDSTAESEAEESLKRFIDAFEEAYKKHKTWVVPDPKLRSDIQASIAKKLIPGYSNIYTKYPVGSSKIVKFTPEDLNNHISDLYIGSVPASKNDTKNLELGNEQLESKEHLEPENEQFEPEQQLEPEEKFESEEDSESDEEFFEPEDILVIPAGPMTRSIAKKFNQAVGGLLNQLENQSNNKYGGKACQTTFVYPVTYSYTSIE